MRFFYVLRALLATIAVVSWPMARLAFAQAQPGQSEFVPIEQLPPTEQLPAAPLLIAAYAFVWMAVIAYLWLTWRRLGRVERELQDLARRQSQRAR